MSHPPGNVFEHEVAIDAPLAAVWKAISDGAELRRWFPIDARVKPPSGEGHVEGHVEGKGGSIFLSWGPACEGEAPITLWEPGEHLRWVESHEGGAVQIAVDFFIETRAGGETVLRVVQSGFGRGAKWDDMYDSISSGWKFELASLRHYLTRHSGKDRRCMYLMIPSPLSMEAAWRAIAPADTLVKQGSLAGHAEGSAYSFVGPDGRGYSGTVLRSVPYKTFAGTVRELDDALIRIEIERMGRGDDGKGCTPCFWLSVWGEHCDQAPGIAAAWQEAIARRVG